MVYFKLLNKCASSLQAGSLAAFGISAVQKANQEESSTPWYQTTTGIAVIVSVVWIAIIIIVIVSVLIAWTYRKRMKKNEVTVKPRRNENLTGENFRDHQVLLAGIQYYDMPIIP